MGLSKPQKRGQLAGKGAINSLLYWINELVKQELPQKALDSESALDSIIEITYEICPHPYHT